MLDKEFILARLGREFSYIQSEEIRNLVLRAMRHVAYEFFTEAATSSGKYHPPYAQGNGGLMRHVQAAVYFAKELMNLDMYGFSTRQKDLVIAALILHDSCKRGVDFEKSYTVHEHPLLVVHLMDGEVMNEQEKEDWAAIIELVSSHMGQWTKGKGSKVELPTPETDLQKFVHLCDYLASRRDVDVRIFDEVAEVKPTVPTTRPATDPQKSYIAVLIRMAKKLPTYNPKYNAVEVEDLTMGQASTLISELKELVGE